MSSPYGLSMSRPLRLTTILAVIAIGLAGCGDGGESGAAEATADDETASASAGDFDWRAFEGESIGIIMNQHPWQEAMEPLIPEFEELTGIDVRVDAYPESQFRQRIQVELSSGSDSIDLFMAGVQADGAQVHRNGWYEPLAPYVEDAGLTSDEFDFDDFSPGIIDAHTFEDELVGLPIQVETQMLMYRTDLFEEAGIEVPTTFEELEAAAEALESPDGPRPFVSRGAPFPATGQLAAYLFNHGAEWIDEDGGVAFDSPEGIEAFDFYGRMLREHGPDGAGNISWEQAVPLFQQGEVAMYTDASVFADGLLDPEASTVADAVGFAPMPSGPGGSTQTYWNWSLAMSSFSASKEAAWYFIQWATSPEMSERLTAEGVAGARLSVDFGDAYPEDWVETFTTSLEEARPQQPPIVPVSEVRDAVGQAILDSIEGRDVEGAVRTAADEATRAIDAAGP